MAKKGNEEARQRFQSGPRKGQLRDVPRVAFKQTSKQTNKSGQIHTTEGKGNTVAETKLRTQKGRSGAGQIQSTLRGPRFGRVRGRLPPGLNPLGKLGFLPLLTPSSPTNMVTIKDQNGKSQRVPDTFAAKIKEVDFLQKKADTLSFDEMFEEAAKLNMAGFEWEGKSYLTKTKDPEHKYNVYDLTQKKIKADKEEGDVSITYKGAYLGSRPKTMTEGVDEAKSKQPSKKASKTGLSKNSGPKRGSSVLRHLSKNSGPKLASGGFVTKRGPLKRKS
jgi:hypothetical protein